MQNNPITQRVIALTEQWREAAINCPDARAFCWMGEGDIDYKMINAFALYHLSDQSTIPDVFFTFSHPFTAETANNYGANIIYEMGEYLKAWDNDADKNALPKFEWQALPFDEKKYTDESYFIANLNHFADQLQWNEHEFFVVVITPQTISDTQAFTQWIHNALQVGISNKVRLMLYDNKPISIFKKVIAKNAKLIQVLYPNLNMVNAVHQILEDAKSNTKEQNEKEAFSFQQLFVKLSEAVGLNDKNKTEQYARQCLKITQQHNWPHCESLVYTMQHGLYAANKQWKQAYQLLDKAITKANEAAEQKILAADNLQYQAYITKANLYLMNKDYDNAIKTYHECLQIPTDQATPTALRMGVYQMLGMSYRLRGNSKVGWDYFTQGWQEAEQHPLGVNTKETAIMFYAKEMIETGSRAGASIGVWNDKFSGYWGENWYTVMKNYKPSTN